MRIDPSDLATFLAIARHRSFRAAATELGVSASALSHALRNIEERLDLRLINRTTRSVALTEAGQRLFARVSPAFRDIDDALEDLNSFRGKPAGTLRFNAARQSTQLVLLPIVTRFLEGLPGRRRRDCRQRCVDRYRGGWLRCRRAVRRNHRQGH